MSRKRSFKKKPSPKVKPKKSTVSFLEKIAREKRDLVLNANVVENNEPELIAYGSSEDGLKKMNKNIDVSFRQYKSAINEMITESDVILEVLDARDPMACRNETLERVITSKGKKLIFLINKIDLIPNEVLEAWKTYFSQLHPTVCFKAAATGGKIGHLKCKTSQLKESDRQNPHRAAGVDELLSKIKPGKGSVTVGLLGLPNVGKSSIINSMKRNKVAKTGATPGVTVENSRIKLGDGVFIYDCPGVVSTNQQSFINPTSLVLTNAMTGNDHEENLSIATLCLSRVPVDILLNYFDEERKIITKEEELWTSVDEFLAFIAEKEGRMKQGIPDKQAAASILVRDLRNGRIRFFETPPQLRNYEQMVALGMKDHLNFTPKVSQNDMEDYEI